LCATISEAPLAFGVFVKADRLSIYNIHLDDVSVNKRIAQMKQIRPRIEKESRVIVGGDFNQAYDKRHPVYRLTDLMAHNKCVTYFVEKNMNIDNILTKGFSVTKDTCQFVPSTVTEGVKHYGSDHIPVTTVVY
jgi:endonuclease/exonuclease/phosphatase family metal-dependent hydrolase